MTRAAAIVAFLTAFPAAAEPTAMEAAVGARAAALFCQVPLVPFLKASDQFFRIAAKETSPAQAAVTFDRAYSEFTLRLSLSPGEKLAFCMLFEDQND